MNSVLVHLGYHDNSASFTQVVWKGSKKIGAGIAFDPVSKNTFVVVRYAPAGNMFGKFKGQVSPPKPGRASLLATPHYLHFLK